MKDIICIDAYEWWSVCRHEFERNKRIAIAEGEVAMRSTFQSHNIKDGGGRGSPEDNCQSLPPTAYPYLWLYRSTVPFQVVKL